MVFCMKSIIGVTPGRGAVDLLGQFNIRKFDAERYRFTIGQVKTFGGA